MKRSLCFLLQCVAFFLGVVQSTPAQAQVTALPQASAAAVTPAGAATLPLWTFDVRSSRDGNHYPGAMVGRNPFNNPGTTRVPTLIIPLVLKTHTLGVSFDPATGIIGTQPGDTTFDPTVPDHCYSAPNNIPIKMLAESPILNPAPFVFGGAFVGATQYLDAFQRANFWKALGSDADEYHVLLDPVRFLDPVIVDVPAIYGLSVNNPLLLSPTPFCTPYGRVDFRWFDNYMNATVIPAMAEKGVNPANLPIFLLTSEVLAASVTNLNVGGNYVIFGFHNVAGYPIPTQTFIVTHFRKTLDPGTQDTDVLAHELGEWINDPFVGNPTPLWGHIGQVQGCQNNLEVGDPLSTTPSTNVPLVVMPNGYAYHMQELAFFSWFFGGPSIGVNGWFSDNNTFTSDAGPPCQE